MSGQLLGFRATIYVTRSQDNLAQAGTYNLSFRGYDGFFHFGRFLSIYFTYMAEAGVQRNQNGSAYAMGPASVLYYSQLMNPRNTNGHFDINGMYHINELFFM